MKEKQKFSSKLIKALAEDYAEKQNSAYVNDYYGFIDGFKKCVEVIGGEITEGTFKED